MFLCKTWLHSRRFQLSMMYSYSSDKWVPWYGDSLRALCSSKPRFFYLWFQSCVWSLAYILAKAKEAAGDAKLKQASVRTACVLRLRVCRTSVSQYVLPPPAFLLLLLQLHCRQLLYSRFFLFLFSKCSIEENEKRWTQTVKRRFPSRMTGRVRSRHLVVGLRLKQYCTVPVITIDRYTLFKWIVIKTRVWNLYNNRGFRRVLTRIRSLLTPLLNTYKTVSNNSLILFYILNFTFETVCPISYLTRSIENGLPSAIKAAVTDGVLG